MHEFTIAVLFLDFCLRRVSMDKIRIGYADNIDKQLQQFNGGECIPLAFLTMQPMQQHEGGTSLVELD